MRLKMTALVASALAGFLYVSVPSASALPAPSRSDVTVPNAKTGAITEEVRYRRRGYRRWGYRRYGYRGYRRYGYRPYYYRGYRGYGYPRYYRRRPRFGIYLGF
jgi:hypothetical protein